MKQGDTVRVSYVDGAGHPLRLEGRLLAPEHVDGGNGWRVDLGAISIAFPEDKIEELGK